MKTLSSTLQRWIALNQISAKPLLHLFASLSLGLITLFCTTTINAATAAVSAGSAHTVAVKSDGTVWAWGSNYYGTLGNNSSRFVDSLVPVPVSNLSGVADVSAGAGSLSTMALKTDGTVWAWGNNYNYGLLGNNSTVDSFVPVQVPGLSGVAAVSAGYIHNVALKTDGTVWAWGSNYYGTLGNNSTVDSRVPVSVSGLSGVVTVSAGVHTMSVKSDGTVWGWGGNYTGQLGNNNTSNSLVPVQVPGLSGVVAVSAGSNRTVALKSDGTVWTWGRSFYKSSLDNLVPVLVSELSGVVAVSAGHGHTVALKSDGTVWAWGLNDYGQLGNNSMVYSFVPVPVSGLSGVVAVSAGGIHTVALKSDGTVWAWGSNAQGQIGNNSTSNSLVPVQVVGPDGQGFLNLGAATIFEQAVVPQPTAAPPVAAFPINFADFLSFIGNHSTEFSPETQTYLTAAAAEAAPIHSALTKGIAASYADLGQKTAYDSGILTGIVSLAVCPATASEKALGIVTTVVGATDLVPDDTKTIVSVLDITQSAFGIVEEGMKVGRAFFQANPLCVATTLSSITMLGVEKGVVPMLLGFANDPPDPLYSMIVTPQLPFLPRPPLTNDTSFDSALATFAGSTFKAAALLEAVNKTYDRYSTALAVGDSVSAARQLGAALKYLVAYDSAARASGISLAQLDTALRGNLAVTAEVLAQLLQLQQSISLNGLPSETTALLVNSGFTSTQINTIKEKILSLDPDTINSLNPNVLATLSTVLLRVSSAGDINRDAFIDKRDQQMVIADLGKTVEDSVCGTRCDLNGDGKIDQLDISQITALCGVACNRPPVANGGQNQTVRQGSLVTLDGTASSDPDNGPSPLSFLWSQVGTTVVTLNGATTSRSSFTPSVKGAYAFNLVVSDGQESSAPASVTISVPALGDIDADGDVDTDDLAKINAALNQAASGANDLRDINGDRKITALDSRKLVTLCTRPRCATR